MKKRNFIVIVFFIALGTKVQGQISTNELPVSFSLGKSIKSDDDKALKSLPNLPPAQISQEDMEAKGRPPRFGYKRKVNYNLDNSGNWKLRVQSPSPGLLKLNQVRNWKSNKNGRRWFR